MKQEIILFKISGDDRPGLTSILTGIIAEGGATILDIAQSDIHSTLSLGILFRSDNAGVIIKELLFAANKMGITARFDPVDEDNYNAWVARQGKDRFIVTLLGPDISAPLISKVSGFIATQGLNIDAITRLTGRMPLNGENAKTKACVELSVRGTPINKNAIHSEFVKLSRNMGYDISFQEDNLYRRNRRLICFDMDSTLIKTECIDQLAERAGVGDKVKAITERAMKGEIDFSESFARRVALLKGLNASVMQEIAENLPLMDGADRLLTTLKKYGYKVAILSGGFTFFCDNIKRRFNLDYVYANELEIDENNCLTGRYLGDIVDGRRKAELLRVIAQLEGLDLQQVIAVGDGANDLPMLQIAGLGIAYHAKPKVEATAKQAISSNDLDSILYLLGFKDSYK